MNLEAANAAPSEVGTQSKATRAQPGEFAFMSLHDTAAEQLTIIVPTLNEAPNTRPLLRCGKFSLDSRHGGRREPSARADW